MRLILTALENGKESAAALGLVVPAKAKAGRES